MPLTCQQAARVGLVARHQLTGKGLLPLGPLCRLAPLPRHRVRLGAHRCLRLGVPQLHLDGRRAETLLAAGPHLPAGTKLNCALYFSSFSLLMGKAALKRAQHFNPNL